MSLVQPLFSEPLDVIGDVHGELQALQTLMGRLGYTADGRHPAGRRLVFLGDLTDRGPDSPGVVRCVRQLIADGRAQCVLGNHDFNLLLGARKYDNRWFFGETFLYEGRLIPQVLADDQIRQEALELFRSLPLVLIGFGIRIVHACWDAAAVHRAQAATDAVALYHTAAREIAAQLDAQPALQDRHLALQNGNPVRLLTSGPEQPAERPFEASGKLRVHSRVPWWESYNDDALCVFGHYAAVHGKPHGQGRAICVDYAVGKRWTERIAGDACPPFRSQLAALRLPEHELVFDNAAV